MMPLGEAFYRRKVEQIQSRLDADNLDGLLLLDTYNVMYASGFIHTDSERPIGFFIPKTGNPALFVPLLEQDNAADTWIGDIRTYFEYPGEEYPVVWMRREAGVKRLGIDSIGHDIFMMLNDDAVTVSPIVQQMRWIKDPEELEVIKQAARYADYCLEQVLANAADIIRDGGTELDILRQCIGATSAKMKAEIGEQFRLRKSAVVGTVHSGARAALPHGSPITKQPQPGETLIAGIGASVAGYHAESGATFVVGAPSGDTMHCLQAAENCNQAAIQALTAGATCASVNDAALNVLRDAGLGDAIRHRIGHGMGIQGHEAPWLAPGDNTLLTPNMVFSNEPGIYRPGLDGYRTINTMIVTDGAALVPSRFLAMYPPEKRILDL
ncbi:MAG: M24 family metallopeptidase [Aggregatilineales bacterium]